MMSRFLLSLVLLFTLTEAQSQPAAAGQAQSGHPPGREPGLSYGVSGGARSKPIGAALIGEIGYDQPLWGDWRSKESFSYGYVRPLARAATSVVINGAEVALELRPISILGLTLGKALTSRSRDHSKSVNCWEAECGGQLRADFATADLLVGVEPYFYSGQLDWREWRPSRDQENFYDDGSGLIGKRGFERILTQNHTLGFRLKDWLLPGLAVAMNWWRAEARYSGQNGERLTLVGSFLRGDLRLTGAIGYYQSSLQRPAPYFALLFGWPGRPGLRF